MKKLVIPFLALFAILSLSSCGYNSMVEKEESIKGKWADVEAQYQRRSDLIPNLVSTVKGYANFEQSTLTAVIEARAKATSVQVDASKLTPETMAQYQQAQGQLSSALSRLLVTVEQYPDLKANENFRDLQAQLEGTENRITVARQNFNSAVEDYNGYIRKFPNNLTASMFSFTAKEYFKAEEGTEKAPKVEF